MINVHHMYNKGTTPLSHGVGSTHYGAHPCERGVVHLLYMWCTGITSQFNIEKCLAIHSHPTPITPLLLLFEK